MTSKKLIWPCYLAILLSFGTQKKEGLHISISPLTKDCYVYTSYSLFNEKPFPANGLYIVAGDEVVLIDSPWTEAHTQELLDSIQKRHGKKVTHCIATHFHADRTGGFDVLKAKGVKTWSTRQTLELCRAKNEKQAGFTFSSDTVFKLGGITLETFYPGKGHSPDNIVVWVKERRVLHGGCFVKSTEANSLGNLSDADVSEWERSIKKTMKKFPDPVFVVPGHFGWENKNSLKHTLRLLKQASKKTSP